MNTDTPTTTSEDANRPAQAMTNDDWFLLAERVVADTHGDAYMESMTRALGDRTLIVGMEVYHMPSRSIWYIESPQQYEDILKRKGYINGEQ